jgi:hypothetical protein
MLALAALLPPALLYVLACQAGTARAASTLDTAIASADVVMFTLPTCPFCKEAARALKVRKTPFIASALYSRIATGMHGPTCRPPFVPT